MPVYMYSPNQKIECHLNLTTFILFCLVQVALFLGSSHYIEVPTIGVL